MNYIKTNRFSLDPHNGSGTRIVIPKKKRKSPTRPKKWNGELLTTESIEYYQEKRRKPRPKAPRSKVDKAALAQSSGGAQAKELPKIKKSWLIKPPNTIMDNYIIFERL